MRRDVIGAAVLERDREHEIRSPDQRVVTEPSRVADEHLAGVQGIFGRGHVDLGTVVAGAKRLTSIQRRSLRSSA